jgi:hypothetical protein
MTLGWRQWTRGQWGLRLVVLAGPLVALLARGLATEWPPLWLVLLVGALAAGWAFAPESVIGAVALLVVGFSWATGLEGRLPIAAVLAAAAMLAAHLAALEASYGPDALPVSAPVVRLWVRRGLLVFLAAPAVWALGRGVDELPTSGTVWVVGLVVSLSVTIVAAAVTQATTPRGDT